MWKGFFFSLIWFHSLANHKRAIWIQLWCGAVLIGKMSASEVDGRWSTLALLSFFVPGDPLDGLLFKEESKVFWNESWNKRLKERKEGIAHWGLLLELSWLCTWTLHGNAAMRGTDFLCHRIAILQTLFAPGLHGGVLQMLYQNGEFRFHLNWHFEDVNMPAINDNCLQEMWDSVEQSLS